MSYTATYSISKVINIMTQMLNNRIRPRGKGGKCMVNLVRFNIIMLAQWWGIF